MRFRLVLALAALPLPAAPAAGQLFTSDPDVPSVTASASVTIPVAADRALVYAALAARAPDAASGVREVGAARDRAVAALAPLGIGGGQVVPWGYGFGTDADPRMRGGPPSAATEGRIARQGLRVVVERLDRLDAVLAALAEAGAEAVPVVQFEASRTADARGRAIEQAVTEAREQAEAMARAAGGRLGELMSLVTHPDGFSGPGPVERFLSHPSGMQQGVGLAGSDVTVRVRVYGVWRFHAN